MLKILLTIVGYRQRFLGVNVPHLGGLNAEIESRYNLDDAFKIEIIFGGQWLSLNLS